MPHYLKKPIKISGIQFWSQRGGGLQLEIATPQKPPTFQFEITYIYNEEGFEIEKKCLDEAIRSLRTRKGKKFHDVLNLSTKNAQLKNENKQLTGEVEILRSRVNDLGNENDVLKVELESVRLINFFCLFTLITSDRLKQCLY